MLEYDEDGIAWITAMNPRTAHVLRRRSFGRGRWTVEPRPAEPPRPPDPSPRPDPYAPPVLAPMSGVLVQSLEPRGAYGWAMGVGR